MSHERLRSRVARPVRWIRATFIFTLGGRVTSAAGAFT